MNKNYTSNWCFVNICIVTMINWIVISQLRKWWKHWNI
jgi:hypothetical protein